MLKRLLLAIALLGALAACGKSNVESPEPAAASLKSGAYEFTHDGEQRRYRLFVPENLPASAPLVLVHHGLAGYAGNIARTSEMDDVAQAEGFVVAYPQGTRDSSGKTFFDVGYEFHQERVDDVGYSRELAAYLVEAGGLNAEAVFVTGLSNGGDLAYKIACSEQTWVRSIASVAGKMMQPTFRTCNPARRLSVLEVHGSSDPVTRWEGDLQNKDGWGPYVGQMAALKSWVARFDLERQFTEPYPGLAQVSPSRSATSITWSTRADRTQVQLITLHRGRHVWPGRAGSQAVWDFFERQLTTEPTTPNGRN